MGDGEAPDTAGARPVVTLFEQYGAGADYVGRKVAERLGLPYHAQAFTSEALESGPGDATDQGAMLARVYATLGGAYGGLEGRDIVTTQRQKYDLVMENNRQVWEYADEGGVIVGRNATVVLAERPNVVHVLLTGTAADRVRRAAELEGLPQERPPGGSSGRTRSAPTCPSRCTAGTRAYPTATTWSSTPAGSGWTARSGR